MSVSELEGKVLCMVDVNDSDEVITFETEDGITYQMLHYQDCCEYVTIEDIVGQIDDLIGTPIVSAKEEVNSPEMEYDYDSQTYTFYHFRTALGDVTIRWYGTSNGYYSERASFVRVDEEC